MTVSRYSEWQFALLLDRIVAKLAYGGVNAPYPYEMIPDIDDPSWEEVNDTDQEPEDGEEGWSNLGDNEEDWLRR